MAARAFIDDRPGEASARVSGHDPRSRSVAAARGAAPTDAELVEKAQGGDVEAFDMLIHRHLESAHTAAISLLANRDDAEDVCQDAFLTAFKRLGQCRDSSRFRAWLLRIVRNRAHNFRRYYTRHVAVDIAASTEVPARSDPAREAEKAELREVLMNALRGLSERQREVVLLFDMEGWSHQDISASLGISEGASRAALFKGRSQLRSRLRDHVRLFLD